MTDLLSNDFHSHSWFLISELLKFNYGKVFWNRREMIFFQSYRELLGKSYFESLGVMKGLGESDCVRVVFCFDD